MVCRPESYLAATEGDYIQCSQPRLSFPGFTLGREAAKKFRKYEISHYNNFAAKSGVQCFRIGIRAASEIIDPNRRVG
jgi:hypothetical protein